MIESYRPPVNRPVTLRDVAEAAGVSSSAASVVLNGARSGTRVSESTQKLVVETAARLGYRPHRGAQALATGRTGRIGFYSGRSTFDSINPFFAATLNGIMSGAQDLGYDVLINTKVDDRHLTTHWLRSDSVDGIILHLNPDCPILEFVEQLTIPAIVVGDHVPELPSVTVDDAEGGRLLAQHLRMRGHRHVLVKQSLYPPKSATARITTFCETAASVGMRITFGDREFGGGRIASSDIEVISAATDPATAIMVWSDLMAEQCCRDLENIGISVPEQVAVVGFDGLPTYGFPKYQLTTISAPWATVGSRAVELLSRLLRGETIERHHVLPVSFRLGTTS